MQARDWRDADDAVVANLYAGERARWHDTLSWDTSAMWSVVEAGRRAGTVVGAIARDVHDAPAGWCFALLQDGTLQVGGFLANSTEATAALLETLAASADGRAARRWLWFGYFDAPGLDQALAARGTLARYVYLHCRLAACGGPEPGPGAARLVRSWRASDVRRVPALLASAYAHDSLSRPFAPSGSIDEWCEYAALLVGSAGCGVFEPGLSLVAETRADHLDAAAVITRITPDTAHLAQLAVRADAQAAGLGRTLLQVAKTRARAAGCTQLTLLVHEQNQRARRLYAQAGFEEGATFLSSAWDVDQPRTFKSDALATGGVNTRR
ncbi:MAG TPA: GNAT family N-acetyltransferase [Vicinamibacterales bacterium]|nr:GNAT family N-acetyltransferase [Vicinamibacterales bacterium]